MSNDDRENQIRAYAERMRRLIAKRNLVSNEIRDLHAEIARTLGIPKVDFVAAMRLHQIAQKDRQSTAKHIGEILMALGSTLPRMAPPAAPPPPFRAPILPPVSRWPEARRAAQSKRAREQWAARRAARAASVAAP